MRRLLRRWLGTLSADEIETLVHAALVDSDLDDMAMRAIADQQISPGVAASVGQPAGQGLAPGATRLA